MLFFFADGEEHSSDISEPHSDKDNVINNHDYFSRNREHLSCLLGDLCNFACIWCSFECNSYFDFCHHVQTNHGSKIPANLLKGDAESHAMELKLIKCKLCSFAIPHDSYCIYNHLCRAHGKKPQEIEKTKSNFVTFYPCTTETNEDPNFASMQKCFVSIKVSKYLHQVKDAENRKSVACVKRNVLNLNLHKPSMSKLYFWGKVLPVEPTCEIGDLCIFKCYRCKLSVGSIKGMILHEAKCAGKRKMDDNRIIGQYVEEARYHKCRFCDEIFLCDTHLILKHLSQRHSINISNYMLKIPRQKLPYKLTAMKRYGFRNAILTDAEKGLVPLETVTMDVANLCSFKCDNCCATFDSLSVLKSHLKKCIGNTAFKNKYVTQAIFHKCKLCGTTMLCDKRPIWSHLYNIHGMSVATYENICIQNVTPYFTNQANVKTKLNYNVSDTLADKLLVPMIPPLDKPSNPKGTLPDNLLTNKIGNFCLFACDKCNFKTMCYGGMANHNKKSEHGPGNAKFDKKYVKEARYHKCSICGTIILCDEMKIKDHVMDRHGYGLPAYKDICLKTNLKSGNTDIIKQRPLVNESTREDDTSKQSHSLCSFQCDKGIILKPTSHDEVQQDQVSKKILNLCIFQCDMCQQKFTSWSLMIIHLRQVCKKTGKFDRKYVIKSVTYECQLCQKKLLCDKIFIRTHLKSRHKMALKLAQISEDVKSISKVRTINKKNQTVAETFQIFHVNLSTHVHVFVIPQGLLEDKEMTSYIGNLCIFKCTMCYYQSESWPKMFSHLGNHNEGSLDKFHSDFLLEAVYHKCYICEKGVLCDEELIRRHTKSAHKIFLLDNYRKMCKDSFCVSNVELKKSPEKYAKFYSKLPYELTQDSLSKVPGNECLFSCDKCPSEKRNWCNFRFHKRKKHGDEWFKFDSKFLKKVKYYQCPICQLYILCDRSILLSHLSQHKFRTMTEFENSIRKNGKKTLATKQDVTV